MGRTWLLLGTAILLAGCEQPVLAPDEPGICWRMIERRGREPDFRPMANDVPDIENCAARVEALRLIQGEAAAGAYQGRFIFATDAELSVAATYKGKAYRLFRPEERRRIAEGVQVLVRQAR